VRTKNPERATRLLDVAARLFGTQRFHEVRMDDVASEAGVGKGTIYRYFEDKDELYLALLDRAADQLCDRIRTSVATAETTRTKLEALAIAVLQFFDEQPHVFDLIQRADAQRGIDSPWRKTREEAIHLVIAIFAEGKDRGIFSVSDPTVAALLLLGGLRAVIRFGPRPHTAEQARQLVHMVLFGATNAPQVNPANASI
jgi:AcrR family transcriptional regulator